MRSYSKFAARNRRIRAVIKAKLGSTCGLCSARIRWVILDNGDRHPVNHDGTTHFGSCPYTCETTRIKAVRLFKQKPEIACK